MIRSIASTAALVLGASDVTRVDVPGQPVHVSIEIPGFVRDSEALDTERVLLSGRTENGCIVSVLWEENLPYLSSQDAAKRFAASRRVQSFGVEDVACCEFKTEIRDAVVESTFHAWPATNDYLFDVHVSFVVPKKEAAKSNVFARSDFAKLVRSFQVDGRADPSLLVFPPGVYVFRDEAAASGPDQLDWVRQQCILRGEAFAPHLYLGALASDRAEEEAAAQAYARAADLLEALAGRTPKQTRALLHAVDRAASVHASKKRFDKAIPLCEQAVRVSKPDDPPEIRKLREEALFNLACCYAKTSQSEKALATLKLAIEARPDFKERAAKSELLESLRKVPEFAELVGG